MEGRVARFAVLQRRVRAHLEEPADALLLPLSCRVHERCDPMVVGKVDGNLSVRVGDELGQFGGGACAS